MLAGSEVTGTWQDKEGGRLVLADDGTFSASNVCGDYGDPVAGTSSGFGLPRVRTGTGTWKQSKSHDTKMVTAVRTTYGQGGVWAEYEARGTAAAPVLWAYIGDPDSGHICVLEKAPARR
ncbi:MULTISPECIES: hypothetical protein [unclassified Streptomyces]|uniref:hypothetical protein n=1 Tax=unclassified Streptomyces TaxID=2593676 RepID=UPI001BED3830|nr:MULTISPECIES: hypothetical protein [unclassified Streptomyces]MBT2402777.1 hypothetical protein [Streptomyces sp. ISL-21]MBT2607265.1 hypothetical protein [Streptomyces sp. ISL-87]